MAAEVELVRVSIHSLVTTCAAPAIQTHVLHAPVSSDVLEVTQGRWEALFELGADIQSSHAQSLKVLAGRVDLQHVTCHTRLDHHAAMVIGGRERRSHLGEVAQDERDCSVEGLGLEFELEVNCTARSHIHVFARRVHATEPSMIQSMSTWRMLAVISL
jgi:hypothetical protein